MFTSTWILGIVLFCALAEPGGVLAQSGGFPFDNITTCEEFEHRARFNPYSVIDEPWQIIYFWSNVTETEPIRFLIPSKKRVDRFREMYYSVNIEDEVEWNRAVLMMIPRPTIEVLYLHAGLEGAYRAVVIHHQQHRQRPHPGPLTKFASVRMRLFQHVLGMMCCEDLTAFALTRVSDTPNTEAECLKTASYIGYRGHKGRSYLTVRMLENKKLE